MLHIWHEDNDFNSLTKQFLEFLRANNCHGSLAGADIKGYNGCTELYNHVVYCINNNLINACDNYIILMDNIPDNPKTGKIYHDLMENIRGYNNVLLSDLLCIEFIILDFRYFRSWTRPLNNCSKYDEYLEYRKALLESLKEYDWKATKILRNYICERFKKQSGRKNVNEEYVLEHETFETVACKLLMDLTRFGRFKVDKTTFDDCWTCDCCIKYIGFNTCNLYNKNMNSCVKARYLYNYTKIKDLIEYFD